MAKPGANGAMSRVAKIPPAESKLADSQSAKPTTLPPTNAVARTAGSSVRRLFASRARRRKNPNTTCVEHTNETTNATIVGEAGSAGAASPSPSPVC